MHSCAYLFGEPGSQDDFTHKLTTEVSRSVQLLPALALEFCRVGQLMPEAAGITPAPHEPDPAHPGTAGALKPLGQTIDDMPAHRLTAPSIRACGESGMLAGLVTRLSDQRKSIAILNDAMLFLQAAEMGCDLLTANVSDFDFFDQLLPGTGVLLYQGS